jgi:hypothetical protein
MGYKIIFAPTAIARLEDNVRRLRYDPYFIYYRVQHDKRMIEVTDFWHTARSEPAL